MDSLQVNIQKAKADWGERVGTDFNKGGSGYKEKPRKLNQPPLINKYLRPTKDKVLLELGCGYGRETFLLADKFKEVRAWDISGPMLELARKVSYKPNIVYDEWPLAVGGQHPLADSVYCYGTMQCCEDDVALSLLTDAARATKLGGRFLIFSRVSAAPKPNTGFGSGKVQREGDMVRVLRTPDNITDIIELAGFVVRGYKDVYVDGVFMFAWLYGDKAHG